MKPNILFICCDQQRADCLGFAGKYPVKTPNLDRLAREGAVFSHSFTPLPSCCPARQSLVCGKRPEKLGALWNYDQGIPVGSIEKEEFSWARELKRAGYRTGYVGKWHVSPRWTPLDFGYQDYVSEEELRSWQREKHPELSFQGGFFGEASPYPLEDSPTHRSAANVIRLIDQYRGKPWHIKMDFSEPHLPCQPSEPFASMYQRVPKWRSFEDTLENKPYIQKQMQRSWDMEHRQWEDCEKTVRLYYGMISQTDDAIGRVLAHLEQSGELDNTVIIYTADHGDMCCNRRMMDKHYILYDDVVHVPLVIRYPSLIRQGLRNDALVSNMLDLVPTILEFAGLPVPEDLDGQSLMPYLTGERSRGSRDYVLTTYNGQQFGLYTQRMIRSHSWKYIWNLTDVDELYDLTEDPEELKNLAVNPKYSSLLQKMRLDMLRELKATDDYTMRSQWLEDQLRYNRKL